MAVEVVNLACPNCGASVSTGQKECKYCHSAITIITLNNVFSMPFSQISSYNRNYRQLVDGQRDVCPDHSTLNLSNAMCYLKLRMYDNALPAFEKAFEDNFDSTETLFYASVSLLRGSIAFVTQRKDIDKAMEYLNAALMIEPRGIYHYFLAYIKYDYFERKYLNITPNWQKTLQTAIQSGVSAADITQLAEILQIEMPECLAV